MSCVLFLAQDGEDKKQVVVKVFPFILQNSDLNLYLKGAVGVALCQSGYTAWGTFVVRTITLTNLPALCTTVDQWNTPRNPLT